MISPFSISLLLLWMVSVHSEILDKQKIKRVFETLLEVNNPDDEIGARLPSKATNYMQNLYAEASELGMKGTVRTVAPIIDRWDGKEVLVFPLSHLKIGHRLIRAELHILGGRPDKMARVLVAEGLIGATREPIEAAQRIPLRLSSMSNDAILFNAVRPILHNFSNSTNLVLKLSRWDGRPMRPLHSFVSRHSPFLTIYTRSEDEEETMERRGGRNKRSANQGGYFAYESDDSSVLQKGQMEYIEKGPSMLNTRVKNTKFTRRRYEKMKNKQPFWGFGEKEEMEVSARILKIGNDDEQKERMGERTLEMTTAVNERGEDVDVVLLHAEENKNTVCSKQSLRVDFAEIGWDKWVLSPSFFEAGFCGGECPFPLPKEARASNHALVQSALSSSSSGLPSVCCAPDKMESLTLLYIDQNRNIVLRSFPRMIVESCGCI